MIDSRKKAAGWGAVAVLTAAVSGCTAPTGASPTVWQSLGIPQAIQGTRDRLTNRSGDRPERERKPPTTRIADPSNLESDNAAIKAAAEIKSAEDMAPQKIKALKYLATVGCGCYDKDGKIEEALLAGLSDCTEEVRLEAVNAVRAAAGTCKCTYDGCTPTCCKPSIVKRLDEMAYGVDDKGCNVEPSRAVRSAAARALGACSAVPKTPEPDPTAEPKSDAKPEPKPSPKADSEKLPPPDEKEAKDGESLPPPSDADADDDKGVGKDSKSEAEPSDKDEAVDKNSGAGDLELQSPESSSPSDKDGSTRANFGSAVEQVAAVADRNISAIGNARQIPDELTPPEDMVTAQVTHLIGFDYAWLRLNHLYDLKAGSSLLILSTSGESTIAKVVTVEGASVKVVAEGLCRNNFEENPIVFVGLIAE